MKNKKLEKLLEQITLNVGISEDDIIRELNEIIVMAKNEFNIKAQEQVEMTEQENEEGISEYEGITLTEYMQKYPNKILLESFILEMNRKGYLYPAEGDLFIRDIQISTRLQNALARNGILLVSQLGKYQKGTFLKMRNIGEESYKELEGICKNYGIKIPTLELLEKDLFPIEFTSRQLLRLYEYNIHQAKDIEKFSMDELMTEYRYDWNIYKKICKVIEIKGLKVE